ncbi:D-ribitol-5-phosphate cytidylyltransferase isoform X3 [Petromyzon marinus]|uniref:D-ribitol-5-phosphate cytidylyltransferase isoform X3 n=1 Tax=Petromyzon marinus TaxID=7757 RepID=UPI003F6F9329
MSRSANKAANSSGRRGRRNVLDRSGHRFLLATRRSRGPLPAEPDKTATRPRGTQTEAMGESGPEPAALRAWAVLPAAGSGERLGGGAPKQYRAALGRPLIAHTLLAFLSTPWIEHVVIVVAADHMETMSSFLERDDLTREGRVTLTQGGTTRHRSIRAGLHALARRPGTRPHVVILHDAVRPFVDVETLLSVAQAGRDVGVGGTSVWSGAVRRVEAAGVVRPLVSTVVSVSPDGTLDHVLKRSHYCASEMPQAFRFDVIYDAYEKCSEEELDVGTECLHVALQYGGTRARLLDGPDNLWKVTYKKDLYAAEAIMKESLHRRVGWVSAGDVPLSDAALQFRSALHDSVVLVKRDVAVATHNGQGTSLLLQEEDEEEHLHSFVCVRCPGSAPLALLLHRLLQAVEAPSMRLREPVAIVAVSFRDGEVLSPPGAADDEFLELRRIASESRQRNVLIYGLLVNRPERGSWLNGIVCVTNVRSSKSSCLVTPLDHEPSVTPAGRAFTSTLITTVPFTPSTTVPITTTTAVLVTRITTVPITTTTTPPDGVTIGRTQTSSQISTSWRIPPASH